MALTLLTSEKASITVDLDDGNGNVTPLGAAFHFTFADPIAQLTAGPTGLFVSAVSEGSTTLHLTTMDGSVAADVPITVSLDESAPVPSLVVTFGAPEPK